MFNHTLSAILRGTWLIQEEYANSQLPLVASLLTKGFQANGNENLKGSGEFEVPYFITADNTRIDAYVWDRETYRFRLNSEAITPGSIAVIPFIGPVLKYNGECGEPGLVKRTSWASELSNHPNIIGLISWIDSPGGYMDGTPQYADFVKSIQKPTLAFVSGGAYSAAAWVASGHDVTYCADKHNGFGSIGVYCTLLNFEEHLERQGIKVRSVYADISKDKNKGYRDLFQKNDDTLIKEDVNHSAQTFIDEFKNNRSGKLKSDDWQTGKNYSANDALKIGLIDAIKPFNEAISYIRNNSKSNSKSKSNNNNNNMAKFDNVAALSTVENPTVEQIDQANADLTAEGITKVTLVEESFITESANVTTERDSLKTENETLKSEIETLKTDKQKLENSLQTKTTDYEALENKFNALTEKPGAQHTAENGGDLETDTATTLESKLSSLPHYKETSPYGI